MRTLLLVTTDTTSEALQLLVNEDRTVSKVHALPLQTADLAFPDAGKQSNQKQLLIFVSLDAFEKVGNLVFIKRLDFLLRHSWQNARVRGIGTDVIVSIAC